MDVPMDFEDVVYVGEVLRSRRKSEKVFIYLDMLTREPVGYYQRDIKGCYRNLADQGFVKVAEKRLSAAVSQVIYNPPDFRNPERPQGVNRGLVHIPIDAGLRRMGICWR